MMPMKSCFAPDDLKWQFWSAKGLSHRSGHQRKMGMFTRSVQTDCSLQWFPAAAVCPGMQEMEASTSFVQHSFTEYLLCAGPSLSTRKQTWSKVNALPSWAPPTWYWTAPALWMGPLDVQCPTRSTVHGSPDYLHCSNPEPSHHHFPVEMVAVPS